MNRQKYDKGSKWLLQHQARAILALAGAGGVRSCRPMPSEVVQATKLPDGLLEVRFEGQAKPDHVLVEVATYPEKRAVRQAMDDLTLATTVLKTPPDVLILVLRPKGRYRIPEGHEMTSRLGWSRLAGGWKVVPLWELDAEAMLASEDVGIVPWVPLMHSRERPEVVLEHCREQIERLAHPADKDTLLAVSQVMAELKFPDPRLLALLGGDRVMFESPLINRLLTGERHKAILDVLAARFGAVPVELREQLEAVTAPGKLKTLTRYSARCRDLEAFRAKLLS